MRCHAHAGVFIIVGDTHQLGAVLKKDNSVAAQIAHGVVSARCFSKFYHFCLKAQHRCEDAELFAAIEKIGDGDWPTVSGESHYDKPVQRVRLPHSLFPAHEATDENLQQVRAWVHGDPNARTPADPLDGAIVTGTIALAKEHNDALLAMLDGDEVQYDSIDRVKPIRDGVQCFEANAITPETAKTLPGSGIPPADLRLKVRQHFLGCSCILLIDRILAITGCSLTCLRLLRTPMQGRHLT